MDARQDEAAYLERAENGQEQGQKSAKPWEGRRDGMDVGRQPEGILENRAQPGIEHASCQRSSGETRTRWHVQGLPQDEAKRKNRKNWTAPGSMLANRRLPNGAGDCGGGGGRLSLSPPRFFGGGLKGLVFLGPLWRLSGISALRKGPGGDVRPGDALFCGRIRKIAPKRGCGGCRKSVQGEPAQEMSPGGPKTAAFFLRAGVRQFFHKHKVKPFFQGLFFENGVAAF